MILITIRRTLVFYTWFVLTVGVLCSHSCTCTVMFCLAIECMEQLIRQWTLLLQDRVQTGATYLCELCQIECKGATHLCRKDARQPSVWKLCLSGCMSTIREETLSVRMHVSHPCGNFVCQDACQPSVWKLCPSGCMSAIRVETSSFRMHVSHPRVSFCSSGCMKAIHYWTLVRLSNLCVNLCSNQCWTGESRTSLTQLCSRATTQW